MVTRAPAHSRALLLSPGTLLCDCIDPQGLPCRAKNDTQYSFMGYDARSRQRLPHGYGDEFPAFLTHRGGVDKGVIDLMRPACDKGLRPEALASILLELHSKTASSSM